MMQVFFLFYLSSISKISCAQIISLEEALNTDALEGGLDSRAALLSIENFLTVAIQIITIFLIMFAGNELSKEKYIEAFRFILGAMIVGISPILARIFNLGF